MSQDGTSRHVLVALVALPAMITVPFVGVGLYLTSGRNNEPRAALTLQDGTALRLSAPGTRLDVVDGGYVRMRRQLASEAVSGSSDEDDGEGNCSKKTPDNTPRAATANRCSVRPFFFTHDIFSWIMNKFSLLFLEKHNNNA